MDFGLIEVRPTFSWKNRVIIFFSSQLKGYKIFIHCSKFFKRHCSIKTQGALCKYYERKIVQNRNLIPIIKNDLFQIVWDAWLTVWTQASWYTATRRRTNEIIRSVFISHGLFFFKSTGQSTVFWFFNTQSKYLRLANCRGPRELSPIRWPKTLSLI